MYCHRCYSEMKVVIYDKLIVDYCYYCKGMWLNEDDLNEIESKKFKSEQELLLVRRIDQLNRKKQKVTLLGNSLCPFCQIGHLIPYRNLDICDKCHGIFFDCGELNQYIKKQEQNNWIKKILNLLLKMIYRN